MLSDVFIQCCKMFCTSVGFSAIDIVFFYFNNQRYYFAAGNELMRINGTTKSSVASHLAESITGATTIRAFGEEDRHIKKNLGFIDTNASPFFYSFTANEWLIQRLEMLCAFILSSSALALTLLHTSASSSKSGRCFSSSNIQLFLNSLCSSITFAFFSLLNIPNYQLSKLKSFPASAI